ncbi:hypothetical protein BO85DRAFT_43832 [Aspergillus piperis CBS 112811]|uniref:Uncharacterized protein n=1 Tax=Aspergillus piperis CBS 112811 TaxID=1448313 RepID=A0A8G1VLW8_9EURO|nr:hypothetical protein BO85DRAFT_43832 [Aspergillus piperis CBS 112811]RAH56887.1 hypothetical protein BO85DRAFT_43832 [Aspergillus piperis CBS 112811]
MNVEKPSDCLDGMSRKYVVKSSRAVWPYNSIPANSDQLKPSKIQALKSSLRELSLSDTGTTYDYLLPPSRQIALKPCNNSMKTANAPLSDNARKKEKMVVHQDTHVLRSLRINLVRGTLCTTYYLLSR